MCSAVAYRRLPWHTASHDDRRHLIGPDIGDAAFVKWWEQKQAGGTEAVDRNIGVIEDALGKVISKSRFPRSGEYQIRRGRERIIVERLE
jgi:hypothetical protein